MGGGTEMKHETQGEPALTPEEVAEVRERLQELRELQAQGRLLLSIGLAMAGFVGWMWGDHIKMTLHKIFG